MSDIVQGATSRYDASSDSVRRDDDTTVLGAVLQRTSWGALIAGTVIAISVQMVLTVLGVAIGVTTSEVVAGTERVNQGMEMGAAIWWLASGTISLFIGGCVVGRFAGMVRSADVLLHGFTMWAVTAVFGILVVTAGAGALYGTAMNATYAGTQSVRGMQSETGRNAVETTVNQDASGASIRSGDNVVTATEAQQYVRAASWWTLFALLIGIAAALSGSWLTAPERIAVRPNSHVNAIPHATRTAAVASARSL